MKQSGATSWDVSVVDNTSNGALYALDGPAVNTGTGASTRDLHAQSGWGGSGYSGSRAAGPFAILDSVYSSVTKFAAADPNVQFPPLSINWSVNNVPAAGDRAQGEIGTSFYDPGAKALFILGAENSDTDEYDDHVIIHEWGHYFEDQLSRSDSVGGDHVAGRLDMRVAFGEGSGNALSGIITDDSLYIDTLGGQQQRGFNFNVDDNNHANPGWYSEGSVQSILYDLYDSNDDGMDSVSLGLAHQVLTGEQRATSALTSIFSFVTALKAANSNVANAIDDLVSGGVLRERDRGSRGKRVNKLARVRHPSCRGRRRYGPGSEDRRDYHRQPRRRANTFSARAAKRIVHKRVAGSAVGRNSDSVLRRNAAWWPFGAGAWPAFLTVMPATAQRLAGIQLRSVKILDPGQTLSRFPG